MNTCMNTLTSTKDSASLGSAMDMIRRALISVSDKTGLVDFVRQLHEHGVEIISTGGRRAPSRRQPCR